MDLLQWGHCYKNHQLEQHQWIVYLFRGYFCCAHTCILLHRNPNSAHVSENPSETQIDTTMTFTVLIVSIEQNEEFQESRVHYTLAGIKPLLKIGEGVPEPLSGTLPWLHPCYLEEKRLLIRTSCFCLTCSALLTLEMNVGHDRPLCKKHVFHS